MDLQVIDKIGSMELSRDRTSVLERCQNKENGKNAGQILDSNLLDKNELLELTRGGTSVLKRCAHTDHGRIAAKFPKPKINWKEKLRKRKHKKLISKMEKLRDMEEMSKYMVENLEK